MPATKGQRPPFDDRADAGRVLAARLDDLADRNDVVVLGLPRGGVPVAAEVAAALDAPLDVLVVRKLGLPMHPELAMGAIAGVGDVVETVRNAPVLATTTVSEAAFEEAYRHEVAQLQQRQQRYRDDRPAAVVSDRVVILVDDGLATGSTMRAAVAAVRHQEPGQLLVAVPVASPEACRLLQPEVEQLICIWSPDSFAAVGQGYHNFNPVSDNQVRRILSRATRNSG